MSGDKFDCFQGSDNYVTSDSLRNAVNCAIALGRPLLIRGEPGTGKTLLAHSIAKSLGKQLIAWNIKSTTKAHEGLYMYDTVQRLNDSRFGDKDVSDIRQYIKLGKMGKAFNADEQAVLLIDEIDKADIEFPNDLLIELDEMKFYIPEINETISAKHRPITIITSNAEKELPDAFLRRCVFHYIEFPEKEMMDEIVRVHFPDIEEQLLSEARDTFYRLRDLDELRKKPSTSELIDWIRALLAGGISYDRVKADIPYAGTMIKKESDFEFFTKQYHRRAGGLLRQ